MRPSHPTLRLILAVVLAISGLAVLTTSSLGIMVSVWRPYWRTPLLAQVIVVGHVQSKSYFVPPDSLEPDRFPGSSLRTAYTDYAVGVTDTWKGDVSPGSTLLLRVLGGKLPGGGGYWVEDSPEIDEHHEMVLFLGRSDRPLWKDRWYCVSLQPWIADRGRVSGEIASGLSLRNFKRLVRDVVASASRDSALWGLPSDSIPPGSGRVRGCIKGTPEGKLVLHIPGMRLVCVSDPRDGHFVLPPLPAGTYRMSVIPSDSRPGQVKIPVRTGQADSVIVTQTRGRFSVTRI